MNVGAWMVPGRIWVPVARHSAFLEANLTEHFGGFTRQSAIGMWQHGYEDVYVYEVCVVHSADRVAKLREVFEAAARSLLEAGEEAVMMQLPLRLPRFYTL